MKRLFVFLLLGGLVGCVSHTTYRGNVAMKISKKEAHVCLGSDRVKPGDKVTFLFNDCTQNDETVEGLAGLCELVTLGTGTVTKNLNAHYSTVETDGSFNFSEGTLVQKIK